jgi:two-component sensor histidine kinase
MQTPLTPDAPIGLCTAALQQAPFAVLIFSPDEDLTVLWRNPAHERMTASEGRDVTGLPLFEAFPPNEEDGGDAAVAALLATADALRNGETSVELGPYRFDLPGPDGQYVEHHWQMQMSRIETEGALTGILQVAQDVTHKVLNQRLAESHKRASRRAASVSYFSYDPETDPFVRSTDVDALFGFAPDEAGPKAAPFFERVAPEYIDGVHAEVARVLSAPRGEVASFDYRVDLPDGGARFVRIRGEIATDPIDRRPRLVGTFVDLTDVEETRKTLQAMVDMKEALLAEANHRIKNSLQMALSMLRLEAAQLRRTPDATVDTAVEAMGIAESRIRSVAAIHGMMRLNDHVASVDADALLADLVDNTRASVGMGEDAMQVEGPGLMARLDSDHAIVFGLIVNELLTNAIKYGWSEASGGAVRLGRSRAQAPDGGGMVGHLIIDNPILDKAARTHGIGSSGLGTDLVEGFLAQIDGTLDREEVDGHYVVRLSFPLPDA